jgi:hypothetical protein
MTHFFLPFIWGLVILLSWAGYGRIVQRWVSGRSDQRLDFGLCAAFGVTVELLVGGLLVTTRT